MASGSGKWKRLRKAGLLPTPAKKRGKQRKADLFDEEFYAYEAKLMKR